MPSVYTSVLLDPKDTITSARALVLEEAKSYSITLRLTGPSGSSAEVAIYADHAHQLADFFRAGLAEAEKLMPSAPSYKPGDPLEFAHASDPTNYEPACDIVDYAIASAERTPQRGDVYDSMTPEQRAAYTDAPPVPARFLCPDCGMRLHDAHNLECPSLKAKVDALEEAMSDEDCAKIPF